ncbi:MAG: DUF3309 family protein [Schlesneria sp.]
MTAIRLLVLMLLGAVLAWYHIRSWGNGPYDRGGTVMSIPLIRVLSGRI